MELEVGMYVRTKKGTFSKILEIDKNLKYQNEDRLLVNEEDWFLVESDLLKASYNIIDLIEVGDFVNGKEVKHIAYFEGVEEDIPKLIFVDEHRLIPGETCENDEIKSIVTKEQFSQMEYKVGE